MSFLAPLFLLGLLAAAIPVAIHFIRRDNPPTVMFGTLRFIKQTRRRLLMFQKVQQWLLLLLRTLLVVLLVLVFARPLIYQSGVSQLLAGNPESLVIIADRSVTMQFSDRDERLIEAVEDRINRLSEGDEAALITFGQEARLVAPLSQDINVLRNQAATMAPPGYHQASLTGALQLADDLLASSLHENRRIVVFSAFPAQTLPNENSQLQLAPGTALELVSLGGEQSENLTLTDVRVPELRPGGEDLPEILARVRSTGTMGLQSGEIELLTEQGASAALPVDLATQSERVVSMDLPSSVAELLSSDTPVNRVAGRIELSDDDFNIDNTWYFAAQVNQPMQVLVVNGSPAEQWFDDEAHWFNLAVRGVDTSPFELLSVSEADFSAGDLQSQDVLVLLNAGGLNSAQMTAVRNFVNGGGALWLVPGDRVEASWFNTAFGSMTGVQLQRRTRMPGNDYRLMADINWRHPALQYLDVDWGTQFNEYWQIAPGGGNDVLMRLDSGEPLLIEATRASQAEQPGESFSSAPDGGRVMLFASSLDQGWNNFPLQALYVPFVHEILTYLSNPADAPSYHYVGDNVDLASWFDMSAAERMTLRWSDGEELVVNREASRLALDRPGLLSGPAQLQLAVNLRPGSTDLSSVATDRIYDRYINPETDPVISEDVRVASLQSALESPQRLWWWIALLAFFLLLAESFIANRTYR
ncbi:VWA domain-containing protein [Pseudohongiella nitratireducens]|uniref:VWA domain-containing protein n=1 Tax=Pseudohongiella nitratireducens TaxID=1768907 RepID=UPI0030ED8EB3|tara:strand:- start:153 stop:2252 length:2100 start_codon:yes stop_codon:yes gene_type:complete